MTIAPAPGRVLPVEAISAAARRIAPHIRRTPLERSEALSRAAGRDVHLKLECLQRTGSFKVRGALNAAMCLATRPGSGSLVTASAGNHGLGIAFAARALGMTATVFVPASAPYVKRSRIAALGATVVPVDGDYDDAHATAVEHAGDTGQHYVHAYSDADVVAGQGTVGSEIRDDLPGAGTVIVPVGGGGLVGGLGSAIAGLGWHAALVGVQSEATAAMYESLQAGEPTSVTEQATICDGLAGDVDEASLSLTAAVVERVVLVSESDVAAAVRWLYLEEGLTVEGSGAVGVAALRRGLLADSPGPLVVVLTGGNIDIDRLQSILAGAGSVA